MPNDYKDRVVQYPKRFTVQADGADGTVNDPALDGKVVALAVAPGVVTQPGTPLDAEELNARDSFDKIIDLTYVSAGLFSTTIVGFDFIDDDKLTFRFLGTVPDADLELEAEVSVDGGVTPYPLVLKDSGNIILVGKLTNPIQVADVYLDGTDVIINRMSPTKSDEVEYNLPIQSQEIIVAVEASPFGDERIDGESAIQPVVNGDFASGVGDWLIDGATGSVLNGVYTLTGDGTSTYLQLKLENTLVLGIDYYLSLELEIEDDTNFTEAILLLPNTDITPAGTSNERVSAIFTATDIRVIIRVYYDSTANQLNKIVNFKNIMAIPLLSVKQQAMTLTELNTKYPVYFESLKSVENPEIKVTNENLFDDISQTIKDLLTVSIIDEDGRKTLFCSQVSDMQNIPLFEANYKENTQYTMKFETKGTDNNAMALQFSYTDGTQDITFNSSTVWTYKTVTSAVGKTIDYATIVTYGSSSDDIYISLEDFMLNEGTTASTHIKNDNSSKKYPLQTLRSIPNGAIDYIDTENNVLHKLIEPYVLEASDIIALVIQSNIDYVVITPQSDMKTITTGGTVNEYITLFADYPEFPFADSTANIGTHTVSTAGGGTINIIVAKGIYASLAAAQADLAGTIFQYELETEVITNDIDVDGIAFAYKNMTIELIQANGFGFSTIAKHDLNYEATVQALGKALQTVAKEMTILEDAVSDLEDGRRVLLYSGDLHADASSLVADGDDILLNEPLSNFEQVILKLRRTSHEVELTTEWLNSTAEVFTFSEFDVIGTLNATIYAFRLHRDDDESKLVAYSSNRINLAAAGNVVTNGGVTHADTEIWGIRKVVE